MSLSRPGKTIRPALVGLRSLVQAEENKTQEITGR
jgi:hypothetical protein